MRKFRQLGDRLAGVSMGSLALVAAALVFFIALALLIRSLPLLAEHSPQQLFTTSSWRPAKNEFGFLPFIAGTLWVTVLAMILATPPCLLCAIYLAEYVPRRVRSLLKPLIDLLAGVPSVVYGLCGILVVVPFVRDVVAPFADRHLDFIPLFRVSNPTGYSTLSGGIVLAVMVFPLIISLADEVLRAVPQEMREAALAIGATHWQMVTGVVLRRAQPGIIAAIVLGFARAFGETMAVMMVVGNSPKAPSSLLDAAYPLPALIANNYGEMMSIPLYDAALMTAALVLLTITLGFTIIARIVLLRATRRAV